MAPPPHFFESNNMPNIKQLTLALAIAAAATVGTSASAAVQTVDAVGYTFSYDDSFWGTSVGTTFSNSGNVFTFSGLGYVTSATGTRRGYISSNYGDDFTAAVSITAKSGYQISGIVTGATGNLSAISGSAAASEASASVYAGSSWLTNAGYLNATSAGEASAFANGGTSDVHAYSTTDRGMLSFAAGTTYAESYYYLSGGTKASLLGSSASASQDTASFAVSVTAVPEPETYAMLLAGLGLVGAVSRRRRAPAA